MRRTRNDNETSLRIWLKIVLLALLLGSSGAAIGPGPLPSHSGESGEPVATGGFQLIIQNEGSPILYEGSGFLPPDRSGEP